MTAHGDLPVPSSSDGGKRPSLAAQRIRRALTDKGLPKHKHASFLSELMGLSPQSALRKLNGESGWTFDEVVQVSEALKVPLSTLFADHHPEPAVLMLGSEHLACYVEFLPALPVPAPPTPGTLVAIQRAGRWIVQRHREVDGGDQVHRLARVLLPATQSHQPLVMVLDDDPDACDALCEGLTQAGFQTVAHYTAASLLQALASHPADAYVVDWLLGSDTSESLLAAIRRQSAAPLFLLTGKVVTGEASERHIALALEKYGARYVAKPSPASLIAAELRHAIAA